MWQWLASFLTAPIINGFLDAYKAKLDSQNTQGAQAVEVARAALLAEVDARKSANAIIIAEQGRWYTAVIRPLLALPVIIYLWKKSSIECRPRSTRCTPFCCRRGACVGPSSPCRVWWVSSPASRIG